MISGPLSDQGNKNCLAIPCVKITEEIRADSAASSSPQARPADDPVTSGISPAGRAWLVVSLVATFAIRAFHTDQPIVENYVGRQVPTAMVARNLDRGSGVFHPVLDTAPFPNYFVVEPPIYQLGAVILERLSGLAIEQSGRLFSALATALAAWGLFSLVRIRSGERPALLAVMAFAVFPITLRYGRALQPDAAMLGATAAGLACWDLHRSDRRWYWQLAGWLLLSAGIAMKVIAAHLLIPLVAVIMNGSLARRVLVAATTLIPAIGWYAWAAYLVERSGGSHASADNGSIWLSILGPSALFQAGTLAVVGRFLFIRAFTPLGLGLALLGLWHASKTERDRDKLWCVWGASTLATMACVAEKLHHEYYWLALAPVIAALMACAFDRVLTRRPRSAIGLALGFLMMCGYLARSTWSTPTEWRDLAAAGRAVAADCGPGDWIVAPEALLYQADRRGCRMEWTTPAARRAAGEWDRPAEINQPIDLVEFYRRAGARYFADVSADETQPARKALHDLIRQRYKVVKDRADVLIADLLVSESH